MDWQAFKIWYSDSDYIGYSYADWLNAPQSDVQVIIFYLKALNHRGLPERVVYNGLDFHAMHTDHSVTSAVEDIEQVTGHVLHGSTIDFDKYVEILETAQRDYGEGWLVDPIPRSPKGDE